MSWIIFLSGLPPHVRLTRFQGNRRGKVCPKMAAPSSQTPTPDTTLRSRETSPESSILDCTRMWLSAITMQAGLSGFSLVVTGGEGPEGPAEPSSASGCYHDLS